jgi:hypothetical protein
VAWVPRTEDEAADFKQRMLMSPPRPLDFDSGFEPFTMRRWLAQHFDRFVRLHQLNEVPELRHIFHVGAANRLAIFTQAKEAVAEPVLLERYLRCEAHLRVCHEAAAREAAAAAPIAAPLALPAPTAPPAAAASIAAARAKRMRVLPNKLKS